MIAIAALCLLPEPLMNRVRRAEGLGPIWLTGSLVIVVGAGGYGATLGAYRGVEQALYSAIKLPALIFAVLAVTSMASFMLASVLRARLSVVQIGTSILIGLAITSALLGSLAPVSAFAVAHVQPPDPSVVGLPIDAPAVQSDLARAKLVLFGHVIVIAVAGLVGLARVRWVLSRLVDDPAVARRVLWSWLLVMGLVGSELSWLARPFLGKPHLEASFFREEALAGNFLEEVMGLATEAFGNVNTAYFGVAAIASLGMLLLLLRQPARYRAELAPGLLRLTQLETGAEVDLPLEEISRLEQRGSHLVVYGKKDANLHDEVFWIRYSTYRLAQEANRALQSELGAPARGGPFRTAP